MKEPFVYYPPECPVEAGPITVKDPDLIKLLENMQEVTIIWTPKEFYGKEENSTK